MSQHSKDAADDGRATAGESLITEEALDRLRAQIGVERPARAWATQLSADICLHYARYSLATDNPRFVGEDDHPSLAQAAIVPAPTTEYVACSLDKRLGGPGLPGIFALHAQDVWEFYRQPRLDERVNATIKLAAMEEKESRWGGRAIWQDSQIDFWDVDGNIISRYSPTTVRAERQRARESSKYETSKPYVYSDAEVAQILRDYESENTVSSPGSLADVKVGDSIGHVVKGPITVMDLMCWWIGAGGPYVHAFKQRFLQQQKHPSLGIRDQITNVPRSPEDAHFDIEYAKRSGVGNMYDIGRQRTASIVHLLTNWCGDNAYIRRLETRFTAPVFVGDCAWYRGAVSEIDSATSTVTISVTGTNQKAEVHSEGTATVGFGSL